MNPLRDLTLGEFVGLIIALITNVAAFVWAVSKVTNKLDNVVTMFGEYKKGNNERISAIEITQDDQKTKVDILWDGRERRNRNRHVDIDA